MPKLALVLAPLAAVLLSGCLARTAVDVVTLPVRVAGKAVDAVTTSQSEADEKRGREIRKREEKLGKLERERRKLAKQCAGGNGRACEKASEVEAEIDALLLQVPVER